jgi:fatty acid desaturase
VHHSTTRTAKDPDDIEVNAPKSLPLVVVYYLVLVFGIYLYMGTVAITGYKKANERMKKQILVEYALIGMLLAALFALCDVSLVLNLWIIPLLIAAQLSNARGLAEHGLTATGNEFLDTRTVVSSRFVSFFMCNLNYHLEHHLFPGVPWYHLRSIHALLKNDFARAGASVYRGYTHFLVDFFKASRIGIVADVRLLPAHIREEVCL